MAPLFFAKCTHSVFSPIGDWFYNNAADNNATIVGPTDIVQTAEPGNLTTYVGTQATAAVSSTTASASVTGGAAGSASGSAASGSGAQPSPTGQHVTNKTINGSQGGSAAAADKPGSATMGTSVPVAGVFASLIAFAILTLA